MDNSGAEQMSYHQYSAFFMRQSGLSGGLGLPRSVVKYEFQPVRHAALHNSIRCHGHQQTVHGIGAPQTLLPESVPICNDSAEVCQYFNGT